MDQQQQHPVNKLQPVSCGGSSSSGVEEPPTTTTPATVHPQQQQQQPQHIQTPYVQPSTLVHIAQPAATTQQHHPQQPQQAQPFARPELYQKCNRGSHCSDTSSAYSGSGTMTSVHSSSMDADEVDLSGLVESVVDSDEDDLAESMDVSSFWELRTVRSVLPTLTISFCTRFGRVWPFGIRFANAWKRIRPIAVTMTSKRCSTSPRICAPSQT